MKRIASSSNADTIVLRAIYEVEKVERGDYVSLQGTRYLDDTIICIRSVR